MNKLGLLHDGSQIGALEDVFKGMKSADDVFALSNEYSQAGWTVGQKASTATGRAFNAAFKFAGRTQTTLFRLEDEAVKCVALLTQTRQYLSLHGENPKLLAKALKGDALTAEEQAILDRALAASAESIKNTYPTFSRVPAFSYEMARNTVHSYYDNLRLMAGITPDGREVKGAAGKAKAMGIASVNLASRTALLAGSTAFMGWVGSMIYGMLLGDDEEDKNAIPVGRLVTAADEQESYNSMLPWYEQHGTNYIYNTNPEERSFEYAVLDYLDPYGGWKKAVNERIAEYVDLVGAGDSRKARLAVESSFGFFSDIFLNDEVVYGSTMKRFSEKGVPKGSATDRFSKMAGDAVEKTIADTAEFVVGPGPVPESMGALGGALVENIPGMQWLNAGHALAKTLMEAGTPEGMAASEIMIAGLQKAGGVKGKKYVFERDFWRAARNQKNTISQADTTQKRQIMESKAKTYEEYLDEFRIADAARRVAFDHMHANVQSVRDMLGVDTLGIEMELNKAGVKSSVAGIPREYIIAGDYVSATPAAVRTALEQAREAQIRDGVKDPLTLERIYELEQWHIQAIGDKEDQ
jgi:hypothetical protein